MKDFKVHLSNSLIQSIDCSQQTRGNFDRTIDLELNAISNSSSKIRLWCKIADWARNDNRKLKPIVGFKPYQIFSWGLRNTKKTYWKTKICLSYRQSIGLFGVSCYLCQYSFFPSYRQKTDWKEVKIYKKVPFKNFFFSKTKLFAKLLSHSSNTVGHY